MKKSLLLLLLSLIAVSSVIAAGGGGGGGTPSCRQDDWECTEWNKCSIAGFNTRTCSLINTNCKNPNSAKPVEFSSCEYVSKLVSDLKCSNLNTLNERVKCRLKLSEEVRDRENLLFYLPEECRAMEDVVEQEKCVNLYIDSQKCWDFPEGTERVTCWKNILNLGEISEEINKCNKSNVKDVCFFDLKKKVYTLIKLRMYCLEEMAEDDLKNGKVELDDVVNFIEYIEIEKQKFNKAEKNESRRQVLFDVKAKWTELRLKIEGEKGA